MGKRIAFMTLVAVAFSMGQDCTPDADLDGVSDANDTCPNTPVCATVDSRGCPSDDDDDGVNNGCDECPETPTGTTVYGNGCPASSDDGVPSACVGPDPRAKEIEYSLVNLLDESTAQIMIKGKVDNIGTANYLSSSGQQDIELWEDGNLVASEAFVNLNVGDSVAVEYQRTWSISGTEFASATRYQLIVSYDPDIRDDGNPDNDDCRLTNNSILRGTTDIPSLFE